MMKQLSLIVTTLVLFCIWGCGNSVKKTNNSTKTQHPFTYTENKDSAFRVIENKVYSYIKEHELDYSANTLAGYDMWDSITNNLYSPFNYTHSSDADWERNENGIIEYLNWHLIQIAEQLIGDSNITKAMAEERVLTEMLLSAQYKWFEVHFDTVTNNTGYLIKYYKLEKEMIRLQNHYLKDLLGVLTDSDYIIAQPHGAITDELIKAEYAYIERERIPYYQDEERYDEKADRQAFKVEIEAWDSLMSKRVEISNLINGRIKKVFDVATYRLKFNRLRQLKNEFEAYDSLPCDKEILLSDSCTYEELLAYPRYSIQGGRKY